MSKWGHCSFLHSVRYSPSLPKTPQMLLLTRSKALSSSGARVSVAESDPKVSRCHV